MLTTQVVESILARLPMCRIGLLGDLFLDRYFDIDATLNEPSVETGLTAYQVTGVRCYPGALGTVLNNLVALGVGQVVPISFLGDDGEGFSLRQLLGQMPSVDSSCLLTSPDRFTPTYSKPMLHDAGTMQELHRLDIKNRTPTPDAVIHQLLNHLEAQWASFDAVLVLDQVSEANCGVVTSKMREHLLKLAARDPKKFVLADSRERIGQFRGISVKPNMDECRKAVWVKPPMAFTSDDDAFAPLELARLVNGDTFLTLGSGGIHYAPRPAADGSIHAVHIPGYQVTGPIDICGAGDSCSAGIACAQMAGATATQAAAFGNLIASITVQQLGVTGTAKPDQVRRRWVEVS